MTSLKAAQRIPSAMLTENNEEETNYVLPGSLKAEAAEKAKLASESDLKRKKSSRRSLRGGAPASGKNSRANSRTGSRTKVSLYDINYIAGLFTKPVFFYFSGHAIAEHFLHRVEI